MKKNYSKNKEGFTLVETLVAVSILSLAMVGAMVLLGQGISDTGYAKKKAIASFLAQEGIESIRNMRDTHILYSDITSENWNGFRSEIAPCNAGSPCGFDNSLPVTDNSYVFNCTSHSSACNLFLDSNGGYTTSIAGQPSGFARAIWFITNNNDEVEVFTRVSWNQGSGTYNITLSETLFNWVE